jgi:CubicO group peptidase (beta-lactamase class C family)
MDATSEFGLDGRHALRVLAVLAGALGLPFPAAAHDLPSDAAITSEVGKVMTQTHAEGMAVAVIDQGQVGFVGAWSLRDAKGDPLTTDTVMYGASLAKTVFAYTVMQLVDQGKLKLDTPSRDDVRSEAGFAELVRFILGDTGVPYDWEYGDYAGKS